MSLSQMIIATNQSNPLHRILDRHEVMIRIQHPLRGAEVLIAIHLVHICTKNRESFRQVIIIVLRMQTHLCCGMSNV